MCGIIGYIGTNVQVNKLIVSLKQIQNRGYDSAGISFFDIYGKIYTMKYASTNIHNSLSILQTNVDKMSIDTSCCIGHTRWATHGNNTAVNAHPHHDNKNRISLVHNGIIDNYVDLKSDLCANGYSFISDTDSEVIAVQIGYWLDQGLSMDDSIQKTLLMLKGTWALVILLTTNPNKIWATKNGSPLLLGIDDANRPSVIMFVSELAAFIPPVNQYINLLNNDVIHIESNEGIIITDQMEHQYIDINPTVNIAPTTPHPYAHWMKKEIMEQPFAVSNAIDNRIFNNRIKLEELDIHKDALLKIKHLIILGCGTSYHAGLWVSHLFKEMCSFQSVVVCDASEFSSNDLPKCINFDNIGFILLSQSGETMDLYNCLQIIKRHQNEIKTPRTAFCLGIFNVENSMISRECSSNIYIRAGTEMAVASTKSFTSQCIILAMVVLWFTDHHGHLYHDMYQSTLDELVKLPNNITQILNSWHCLKTSVCDMIKLAPFTSIFILGKGRDEAIARESALKIKEVAYIHAEGFSSSSMKHGPIALITHGLPVFIIDTIPYFSTKNASACAEVTSRGANVTVIGANINNYHTVPITNVMIGGLLGNIVMQIIAYELAVANGINPDFPRNLAKVVTVD